MREASVVQHQAAKVWETKPISTRKVIASPTSVLPEAPHDVIEPIDLGQQEQAWRICPASAKSIRTINPIRAIVDPIAKNIQSGRQRGDGKYPISLALGDPTVGGNLPPCPVAIKTIVETVMHGPHAAGYVNACGSAEAREAIARHHSYPEVRIRPDNVIIANGCSGALELALTALLDPGTILLVPLPGFPLYQVIAESHGASVVHYRLDPDRHWECDFEHLEEILSRPSNKNIVRGMVVNNPSNPTGGVFSERHLVEILEFAQKHRLPIVADEIYGDLVFGNTRFHPMAQVAAAQPLGCQVPIITASGLAKEFLLPGWRVGWITFHDNVDGSLQEVEAGANRLAQVILGASHLAQSVIPTLLSTSNPELMSWRRDLRETLERQATFLCRKLEPCHGLEVVPPQGAMYAIVKMDTNNTLDIKDDLDFSSKLLKEENVFVLPGSAFGVPNVFRVVFCSAEPILEEAAQRIVAFCRRHATT